MDSEFGIKAMTRRCVDRISIRVKHDQDNHTNGFSPSIYMAPIILRDLSPSSFNPRVVSIGPIHRKDKNVQAFEERKVSYLTNLLSRLTEGREEVLNSCVREVFDSINEIKACYVWTENSIMSDEEIADMMVMDACFILGFIHDLSVSKERIYLGEMLLVPNVMRDLVLLENQIPFFILNKIFKCTILRFKPGTSLVQHIHQVLSYHNLVEADLKFGDISIDNTHHILSLLHQCYMPPLPITSHPSTSTIPSAVNIDKGKLTFKCPNQNPIWLMGMKAKLNRFVHGFYKPQDNTTSLPLKPTIPSAIDLDRAGVNFKPNQNPISTWVLGMDVKLSMFRYLFGSWSTPTLRMPILKVNDFTEVTLRNLIAYEQTSLTRKYITSYAYAMDKLVNTEEDVAKLVDMKVFVNEMGSNEEVANMINNICKEVDCQDFFYVKQWKKLEEYCNAYWPKNIARMRRTYFSSPWSIIALVAGIILFALTVVQTFFTINPV